MRCSSSPRLQNPLKKETQTLRHAGTGNGGLRRGRGGRGARRASRSHGRRAAAPLPRNVREIASHFHDNRARRSKQPNIYMPKTLWTKKMRGYLNGWLRSPPPTLFSRQAAARAQTVEGGRLRYRFYRCGVLFLPILKPFGCMRMVCILWFVA